MNHSTLTHRRYPSVSFGSTRTQSFIGRCRPDPKYSPTKVLRRYVNVSRFVPGQFKNAVATDALPLRSPILSRAMNHSTLTHRRYPSVSFGSTRTQSFIGRCRPDPKYSPTKVLRRYVNVSRFVPGQFKNAVATDALPLRSPFIELSGLNAIGENGRLRRDGTDLDLGTRGLFASVVSAGSLTKAPSFAAPGERLNGVTV